MTQRKARKLQARYVNVPYTYRTDLGDLLRVPKGKDLVVLLNGTFVMSLPMSTDFTATSVKVVGIRHEKAGRA